MDPLEFIDIVSDAEFIAAMNKWSDEQEEKEADPVDWQKEGF